TLVLTFNSNATSALVDSTLQSIAYSNSSDDPPASVQIDWSFDDGNTGSQGIGGALQTTGSTTVTITAVNDEPTFTNLNDSTIFTEDDTAVVLDADVDISDAELDALNSGSGNYDGSTLTLVRNGSANADDVFSNSGLLANLTESGALTYNGTNIGTVTTNSGGTLVLTFDANATSTLVDSTLQSIAYSNANGTPPASVQIDCTFDDGDPGGALQATGNTTVYIDLTDAANTIVVDTTADIADGDTSNVLALMNDKGADGMVSLREAILATNNTVNDSSYLDRIEFDFIDNQVGHYYYQDDSTPNSLSTIVATTVDDGSINDFDP
ncbi:MAG: hypothetical protein GY697_26725, partial [Desulfobacterales bacterium]|nr:hypothetical protein [Desulfobacterales bacterium]